MTDLTKWRMVPVEAVREMLDAAHFGPNCAYDTALVDQWWAESDARKRLEGGR